MSRTISLVVDALFEDGLNILTLRRGGRARQSEISHVAKQAGDG